MRIGFVELVLLLFIASITVGPNVALFVDRWLRRAQRTSAAAARRKACRIASKIFLLNQAYRRGSSAARAPAFRLNRKNRL